MRAQRERKLREIVQTSADEQRTLPLEAKVRKLEGIDMNKEPADEVGNRTGTSVKSPDLYLSPDQK